MIIYKFFLRCLTIFLSLFFVGFGFLASARADIRAGYAALSGGAAPAWIGTEAKLYQKYGLDVKLVYLGTSATLVPAMISGETPIAFAASNTVVNAALAGADLIMIGSLVPHFVFYIYGDPNMKSGGDLKGKTLAISRFGAATDLAAREALVRLGLKPLEDVRFIQAGGVPEIITMITSGKAHAGIVSAPTNLKAESLGLRKLVDISSMKIPNISPGIATTKGFLRENADTVRAFMKAVVEAIVIARSDRQFTKQVIAKYTRTIDSKALEATYNAYVSVWPTVPLVAEDGIVTALRSSDKPSAKHTSPKDFYDNTIVEQLESGGFIKSLSRSRR